MAEVVAEHVTKRFGLNFVAANDVSLTVADQEFVVLLGSQAVVAKLPCYGPLPG